jgi:hypothetical protein
MLDLNAVIRHLGPRAVEQSLQEADNDDIAITAIRDQGVSNRVQKVRLSRA